MKELIFSLLVFCRNRFRCRNVNFIKRVRIEYVLYVAHEIHFGDRLLTLYSNPVSAIFFSKMTSFHNVPIMSLWRSLH